MIYLNQCHIPTRSTLLLRAYISKLYFYVNGNLLHQQQVSRHKSMHDEIIHWARKNCLKVCTGVCYIIIKWCVYTYTRFFLYLKCLGNNNDRNFLLHMRKLYARKWLIGRACLEIYKKIVFWFHKKIIVFRESKSTCCAFKNAS